VEIHEHDEVGTGPDNLVVIIKDYYIERCIRQSATATSLRTSADITAVTISDRAGIHSLLWTATFADVLLHVLEQAMRLQTDPPLHCLLSGKCLNDIELGPAYKMHDLFSGIIHCLLERQAYRNTVDTRQINHEASDEVTALTNIQLARQLANYLPCGENSTRRRLKDIQRMFIVCSNPSSSSSRPLPTSSMLSSILTVHTPDMITIISGI
jgi:hypothetical protein